MNGLTKIASILYDAATDLKADNDRAEARQYPDVDWAAKNKALRLEMNHGREHSDNTIHTDQVGQIVGGFVKNHAMGRI